MATKVKGLLKGLRYISQIFDEEKEPEMVIGLPTDVKHVAHIGWDGPSVDSPSWMKDFKAPGEGFQSAPLNIGDTKENPEVKWVSEDSSRGGSRGLNSPGRDLPELPKSTRRTSSTENSSGTSSPRKEKSRHSRRHHSKDSSDSVKSNRQLQLQEGSVGSHSPSKSLPDIPKKSRRKKSKESVGEGSTRSSRKGKSSSTYSSQYSDLGPDSESSVRSQNNEPCQTSSSKHLGRKEKKESSELS